MCRQRSCALLLLASHGCVAFQPTHGLYLSRGEPATRICASASQRRARTVSPSAATASPGSEALSRRGALIGAALSFASACVAPPASAADIERVVKGYRDLDKLLKDWDVVTFNPDGAGGREPDAIRKAIGMRTMDSPLFKAEVLFKEAQPTVVEVGGDFDDWISAVETYERAKNNADEFAYTAAFGEYNPGGGKDQVDKYMEKSRLEVIKMKDSLKDMAVLLGLQI